MRLKLGALLTHPIQYYSPWLRHVAGAVDLRVFYAYQQTAEGQAQAGFGQAFEWDVPLLDGYHWEWLRNVAARPGLGSFGGCDTPDVSDLVRRGQFDAFMMFGWNRKCFLQGGLGALASRTPLLIRLDSNLNERRSLLRASVKAPLFRALLPWVADYLSPGVRTDEYLQHYAVAPSRIHHVPHMVDVDRFRAGANRARAAGRVAALRRDLDAGDDFTFLFVGKLIDVKRPQLLLAALERVLLTGKRASLWVVGDGPLRPQLEAMALARNLPVRFLGFKNQSDLPALYAAADCLVLPSIHETWGLVVNEAFACDLPAIVSAGAGCAPDLVEEGRTGWTMLGPDPEHLAALMQVAIRDARSLPRQSITGKADAATYEIGTAQLVGVVQRLRERRGRERRR